jgi:hypothetical protein
MMNRSASLNTTLTLKIAGIVCILSFFVDFAILLLDFNPNNKQSLVIVATSLVDRGIVPLVGVGLIFAAAWMDNSDSGSQPGIDLRFPTIILSIVLGLMFLLIFPIHLNNVNQFKIQTIAQISQEADQAETQLNNQVSQIQSQLNNDQARAKLEELRNKAKAQFTELINDEEKYKKAIDTSSKLPREEKELLKKFKANPQELDKFIAQRTDPQSAANQKLSQVRQRKEDAEKQAKDNAWKSGLRVGVSSLLLAIGYSIIGGTGLKGMGISQGTKRKAPAR